MTPGLLTILANSRTTFNQFMAVIKFHARAVTIDTQKNTTNANNALNFTEKYERVKLLQ